MQILINILLLVGLWYFWPQQKIGVVDTQQLVAWQAKTIAKDYPQGLPKSKLESIAAKIQDTTINYAKKKRIVLIAKTAVLGPAVPDHTDNILTMLKGNNYDDKF